MEKTQDNDEVVIDPLKGREPFDNTKPTAMMLGRWQPWHDGHTALFKKAYELTGQVCIMVRMVPEEGDASPFIEGQDDNPFDITQVAIKIGTALQKEGFVGGSDFITIPVPNIVDISYGRGVGYTFTEHDLGEEIHNISATKIRAEMREKGEL
jgi:hypothetical protein